MKSAIVMGGAPTVWEEVAEALELAGGTADRIAVNWSGVLYRWPLSWWVTHHSEMVPDFRRRRQAKGHPMDGCTVVAPAPAPGVDLVVPDKFLRPGEPSGSSALFGALLGCLHYRRVYVCGVTLANTRRTEHIATAEAPGLRLEREYNQYIPGWQNAIEHDRHGITSKVTVVRDGKLRTLLERNAPAPTSATDNHGVEEVDCIRCGARHTNAWGDPCPGCGIVVFYGGSRRHKTEAAAKWIARHTGIEWRWVDQDGRAMTGWKQSEPPPVMELNDDKGTMRVEARVAVAEETNAEEHPPR